MSRFGLKLVAAMLLIAIIPLVTSIVLVGQVIRVSDSVAEGQTRRVAKPLAKAADAYRALFRARKQVFALRAELLARDSTLLAAVERRRRDPAAGVQLQQLLERMLVRVAGLGALRVVEGERRVLGSASRVKRFPQTEYRVLRLQRPLGRSGARLELRFFTETAPFREFRALGSAQRLSSEMSDLRGELGSYYRVVFLIMFGAALLVATAVGVLIARRTVRRVGLLLKATRNVAEGDLQTEVRLDVRDELGELAESFNEMVRQLHDSRERISYLEKIGAWQEIARRLAHEIKNPLTPIQLAVQQLDRGYRGDDTRYRRLLGDARDIITEEVDGLRRLVTAFSSFAKLPHVRPEPVDLNAMIDDFVKSHAELVERARLEWQPLKRSCAVLVDRMLLKHVLVNLVENAVQAAEEAGCEDLAVKLEARVEEQRHHARLSVTDNGPGMSEQTIARAFDPYYTTKEHGTGLGLAIVKKIVLEHHGAISVASTAGEGTRFTLTLPQAGPRFFTGPMLRKLSRP